MLIEIKILKFFQKQICKTSIKLFTTKFQTFKFVVRRFWTWDHQSNLHIAQSFVDNRKKISTTGVGQFKVHQNGKVVKEFRGMTIFRANLTFFVKNIRNCLVVFEKSFLNCLFHIVFGDNVQKIDKFNIN